GAIFTAAVGGGAPARVAAGADPRFSLDGTALVWVRRGVVHIRRAGRTARIGPGANPAVSDNDGRVWAVSFDTAARLSRADHNSGRDVYMRRVRATGGPYGTDLISASRRGGGSLGGDSFNGGL